MLNSRSRSIRTKINVPANNLLLKPASPKVSINGLRDEIAFGERLNDNTQSGFSYINCLKPSFDVIREEDPPFKQSVLWSKSSGSTSSWSDEFESETTQRVKEKFERVEKILYGEENPKYLIGEYCLWTKTFPYLRVVGNAINIPENIEKNETVEEEIIAIDEGHDIFCSCNIKSICDIREQIKNDLIKEIFEDVVSKIESKNFKTNSYPSKYSEDFLFDTSSKENLQRCQMKDDLKNFRKETVLCQREKNRPPSETSSRFSTNDPFLLVSPVPIHNTPSKTNIMKSHLSALKWQRENSTIDYSSLPQITLPQVPCQENKKQSASSATKRANDPNYSAHQRTNLEKQSHKKLSPSTRNVTLPPIHNLKINTEEIQRSMSSSPRKPNSNTPLSIKSNSNRRRFLN